VRVRKGARGRRLRVAALAVAAACLLASVGCARPGPVEHAQALARQHRELEAVAHLRAHLAAQPNDVAARRLLVRLLAASGDLRAARAEVAELEKRAPGSPVSWIELGHAFELSHRFDEALAAYDTAASVAPRSPDGPREGGVRCARWDDPECAQPRLEEAVRRGARDAETYHVLGLVRLKLRDLDGAEAAYRLGVTADPSRTDNTLGLATVALARGDARGALAAYDAILAQKPRFASGHLGRAWALAKLGRREEALLAIDRAEELGASAPHVARQRRALGVR
jgi:tetratricopeptide (TPR) repeat protein